MTTGLAKFDLSNRTALVTGGSNGLGYYMPRGLLRSGAHVIIAARFDVHGEEALIGMGVRAPVHLVTASSATRTSRWSAPAVRPPSMPSVGLLKPLSPQPMTTPI
jgi:NAD(P)-dependent dehydrogenase (short-subunit alcohol dehydrogenase family)